jgi:hypothetical protein
LGGVARLDILLLVLGRAFFVIGGVIFFGVW